MTMRTTGLVGALLAATLVGCGHEAAPVAQSPTAVVAPPPAAHADAPVPEADVPAPDGLGMTLIVPSPLKVFAAVKKLSAVDPTKELLAKIGGDKTLSYVDLEAPIYGAFDTNMEGAISVGLAPAKIDEVATLLELTKDPNGDYSQHPGKDDAPKRACTIVTAKRRLLCGSQSAFAKYGPYVLKKIPKIEVHSDIHYSVTQNMFELAKQAAAAFGGDASGDIKGSVTKESDSFVDDIDSFDADLSLGEDGVALSFSLAFLATANSPLVLPLLARADRSGLPPGALGQMPADTGFAFYGTTADKKDVAPFRDLVLSFIDKSKTDDDCPAESELLEKIVREHLFNGSGFVVATGYDIPRAKKALAKLGDHPSNATLMSTRKAMEGWTLIEVDDAPEPWLAAMKEVEAFDKQVDKLCKNRKKKKNETERGNETFTTAPKSLPKGTLHAVSHKTPLKSDGPIAHDQHVFIVPDHATTWFAIGEDEGMLVEKLNVVLGGAKPPATLMPPQELTRRQTIAGGFFSLANANYMFVSDETAAQLKTALASITKIDALPAKGQPIVPFTVSVSGRKVTLRAVLSNDAVRDIAALK